MEQKRIYALFYALNRIGAISNAIDPRLKADNLLISINEINSQVIFATDMTIPELNKICDKENHLKIVKISPVESAPWFLRLLAKKNNAEPNHIIEWKNFIKSGITYTGTIDIEYEQGLIATIVHTGGTTGVPKGVMLTNENFNAMALIHEVSGYDQLPKDRFLTFLPPFIAYCLANAINDPLYLGLEVTLIPKFDYKDFPKLVMKHKPNHVLGGPILWEYFIRSKLTQKSDLSFLKSPVSGGDVMNIELENRINEFFEKHNCQIKIQQGYGMSEVAAAACFSTNKSYCAGSVGIPFVKNIISIFDVDTGEELPYGQEGDSNAITAFGTASKTYLEMLKKYNIYFDTSKEPDYTLNLTQSNYILSEVKIIAYLLNSVGECYSKICYCFNQLKTNGKGNSKINSQVDIYSEWAIVFCKYAVEYSENIYEREVYYRNLACAYERHDRLHDFGDHMKLIIENYQKSIRMCLVNYKQSYSNRELSYYATLSYFNKCFDAFFYNNKTLKTRINIEELKKIIKDFYYLSWMAVNDFPNKLSFQALNGLACAWSLVLDSSNEEKYQYYIKVIDERIHLLDIARKNDSYYSLLKLLSTKLKVSNDR